MDLGMTSFRPNGEIDRHLHDTIAARDSFDRELGLDFEAAAEEGEVFDERAIERAITGKHIGQSHAEYEPQNEPNETVRPAVQVLEFTFRTGVKPRSNHHVRVTRGDRFDD